MTRKKVNLAYITNDSARKATFKKRKKGLIKKVSELSTLCGIDACAIIYTPYDVQPEVWPSPLGVQRVLAQFKKMPEIEQSKKMVNQESFLRQRIAKAKEQLRKQQKDNREKEMTRIMHQALVGNGLETLNVVDLNDLGWLVDQNLKDINSRIETLKKTTHSSQVFGTSSSHVTGNDRVNCSQVDQEQHFQRSNGAVLDSMQKQQWLMEFMNSNEQGFGSFIGGEEMVVPFGMGTNTINAAATNNHHHHHLFHNYRNNDPWSNFVYPWEK